MSEMGLILASILLYGGIHSLLAAFATKDFARRIMGTRNYEGLYPFFFNSFAVISLLPILILVALYPGDTVWDIESPYRYFFFILQGFGAAGLLISVMQIDGMRFLGLRQLEAWYNGRTLPLPPEPLQIQGVYRLVRHPLYLFSMLFFWFNPTMSAAMLGLTIGMTLYFILGSWLEEKKLLAIFGDEYASYQAEVPWMLPFVRIWQPVSSELSDSQAN